jgi:phosphoglycolate phosphatase-like HAD superfamily hydrolase
MPLDISRIRALCFDVDGTLSDTDDLFVQRLAGLLRPVRFVFQGRDPRPFARRFVMATESPGTFLFGLPDRLNFDHQLASLGDLIYRMGLGKHPHPFLLIPGVKPLLHQLKPHFPIAIVTARGQRGTQTFLNQFGLSPYFDCIATAQTCRYTKPSPDPILWAAKEMGIQPDACLMIGDTSVDIRAGKSAGAQTVGVLCGFGEEDELRRSGADLILPSTSQLSDILLKN